MKTEICKFNDSQVSFVLDKEHEMMVNATEMAKAFDADVWNFLRLDGTKKFIQACLKTSEVRFLDVGKNGNPRFLNNIEKEDDLIISKQKSGTWMHRILALKFAAWLDPVFEVWVYSTIEELLFGRHVKRGQSFERTAAMQKEREDLLYKPNKTGDDFERYLEIEKSLKRETALRRSLTVEDICGIKSLFEKIA